MFCLLGVIPSNVFSPRPQFNTLLFQGKIKCDSWKQITFWTSSPCDHLDWSELSSQYNNTSNQWHLLINVCQSMIQTQKYPYLSLEPPCLHHSQTAAQTHVRHTSDVELARKHSQVLGDVFHCRLMNSWCPDWFTIMLIQWSWLQKWDNMMLTHTKQRLKSSTILFQTETGCLQIGLCYWLTLFLSSPAYLSCMRIFFCLKSYFCTCRFPWSHFYYFGSSYHLLLLTESRHITGK